MREVEKLSSEGRQSCSFKQWFWRQYNFIPELPLFGFALFEMRPRMIFRHQLASTNTRVSVQYLVCALTRVCVWKAAAARPNTTTELVQNDDNDSPTGWMKKGHSWAQISTWGIKGESQEEESRRGNFKLHSSQRKIAPSLNQFLFSLYFLLKSTNTVWICRMCERRQNEKKPGKI